MAINANFINCIPKVIFGGFAYFLTISLYAHGGYMALNNLNYESYTTLLLSRCSDLLYGFDHFGHGYSSGIGVFEKGKGGIMSKLKAVIQSEPFAGKSLSDVLSNVLVFERSRNIKVIELRCNFVENEFVATLKYTANKYYF